MAEYQTSNELFVNPYNFIPLGGRITHSDESHRQENNDLLSGELKCKLIVKTPTTIPDEVVSVENQHNSYNTYRCNGAIVIPGSSIRGVIRSEYETITNSCLVTTKADAHIASRAAVSAGKSNAFAAALLIKEADGWKLYKAERIPMVVNRPGYKPINEENREPFISFNWKKKGKKGYIEVDNEEITYGDKVFFSANGPGHNKKNAGFTVWKRTVDAISKQQRKDLTEEGYLYLGEPISGKHADGVFVKRGLLSQDADVVDNARKALDEVYSMYNSSAINRNLGESHDGYPGYKDAKERGIIPVWYDSKEYENYKRIKLSLASIGRFAYSNNLDKITINHSKCMGRNKICPACALFGMIGDNNLSKGSLVRITDAELTKDNGTTCGVLLKELGAPRTSYLPFYSKDGDSYDAHNAVIRGRKFYWHISKAAVDSSVYSDTKGLATQRNSTVELINPGNEFEFSVYYDGITAEQLEVLKYVLMLGGNDNNNMHKIGHGKPIGLGSVKIQVINDKRRMVSPDSYSVKKELVQNADVENISFVKSDLAGYLQIITDFNAMDKYEVRYPYIEDYPSEKKLKENVLASHQWFRLNKDVLPPINSRNMELKAGMIKRLDDKDYDRQNSRKTMNIGDTAEGTVVEIRGKNIFVRIKGGDKIKVHATKVNIGKRLDFNNIEKDLPVNSIVSVKRLDDDSTYGAQYEIVKQ